MSSTRKVRSQVVQWCPSRLIGKRKSKAKQGLAEQSVQPKADVISFDERSKHRSRPRPRSAQHGGRICPDIETETDPRLFHYQIDLIEELATNAVSHQTYDDERAYVYINNWNVLWSDYLEVIRDRVPLYRITNNLDKSSRATVPGMDPAIACCLFHGATVLSVHEQILRIESVRTRVNQLEKSIRGERKKFVTLNHLLKHFEPEIGSHGRTKGQRPCPIPPATRGLLTDLHNKMGLSLSSIATVCLQIVLCVQLDLYPEDAGSMADMVKRFLDVTQQRAEDVETLLERLVKD